MKKLSSFLTLLLAITSIFILAACSEKPCEHNWSNATCTTAKVCTLCNETEGSALGHSFGEWNETLAATCTTDGSKNRQCSVCQNTETQTITKLGHNHKPLNDIVYINTYGFGKYECETCHNAIYKDKDGNNLVVADLVLNNDNTIVMSCSNIATAELLIIPETVKSFDDKTLFSNCDSLQYVLFNEKKFEVWFQGSSIKQIVIPAKMDAYLSFCDNLKTVIWDEGSTQIDGLLWGSSVENIIIPKSMVIIESNVFNNCKQLSAVYYMGTASDWDLRYRNGAISYIGNDYLKNATRYYYSETQPTEQGNYWHYVDGVPTIW